MDYQKEKETKKSILDLTKCTICLEKRKNQRKHNFNDNKIIFKNHSNFVVSLKEYKKVNHVFL